MPVSLSGIIYHSHRKSCSCSVSLISRCAWFVRSVCNRKSCSCSVSLISRCAWFVRSVCNRKSRSCSVSLISGCAWFLRIRCNWSSRWTGVSLLKRARVKCNLNCLSSKVYNARLSWFHTLRIFHTPHFPYSSFSTLRTPHSALRTPHSAFSIQPWIWYLQRFQRKAQHHKNVPSMCCGFRIYYFLPPDWLNYSCG